MPQMTDRDYSTTTATEHRGKNLSKTNNKVQNLKSVFVRHALGMQIPHEQGTDQFVLFSSVFLILLCEYFFRINMC
ncbi:hypothetical protein M153_3060009154 [Pseudoloma neurophilia]|uniref:Uncharacterized protein n=1 Tax=Pseudoloma neurophilia TaxID=146866 RepID=A0A0R0M7F5_9MICR|nr:hypothetical protein M153_3060009154 [Pseudoloma neurophilia]